MATYTLSTSEAHVLRHLADGEAASFTELVAATRLTPARVSDVLSGLQVRGYVDVQSARGAINLTRDGSRVLRRLRRQDQERDDPLRVADVLITPDSPAGDNEQLQHAGANTAPNHSTLEVLGPAALSSAISFLVDHAGDVLKQLRRAGIGDLGFSVPGTGPVSAPGVLEGELAALAIHTERTTALQRLLRSLRHYLSEYDDGVELVDSNDNVLVLRVDLLRHILEAIYGQHITFVSEPLPASGTPVAIGDHTIQDLLIYGASVAAQLTGPGETKGTINAGSVIGGVDHALGVAIGRLGD